MVPDTPIEHEASCSLRIVAPGMFDAFKAGLVEPIRGTYDRYEGDQVVLASGERTGGGLSILAVGWRLGVPFLAQDYLDKLIEADGQYRTYRLAVNPDLPDMGFVGSNSIFCTVLSAEMIANWLVRYADEKLEKQPSQAQ